MIGADVLQEGYMEWLAIALAAYMGGIEPLELWRTRLPVGYVEVRAFNRVMYAPSYVYFENMKSGCTIVSKDIEGVKTCKMVVEEMDRLSTMIVNEVRHASITRFGSGKFEWQDTIKAAHSNAAKYNELCEPPMKQFPMLHILGLGGEKVRM